MNTYTLELFTLSSFVAYVVEFPFTEQGDNGLPGPRGPPGGPGELGKNVGYRSSLGIISKPSCHYAIYTLL